MLREIDDCVEAGHSFAFETTLSGLIYLKKIALWQARGYQGKLWFLSSPNDDIAVSRVAYHVLQGGHDIRVWQSEREHPENYSTPTS
jgi:predicted ABC-type ATPase